MRSFLFVAGNHQAVTIDQAGRNLPRSDNGDWQFCRAVNSSELTPREITMLDTEDFFLLVR